MDPVKKTTLIHRLGLSALGALVPMLAAEAALRLAAARRPPDLAHARRSARVPDDPTAELRLVDLLRVSDDPDLVYELVPGAVGRFRGVPLSINDHGMRDGPVLEDAPRGRFRIALLGDSIGFGWGVRARDAFGEVLERSLRRDLGLDAEVLNFCVPGYNTWSEAACYLRRVRAFAPDLVVLQYFHNDRFLPNFLLVRPPPPRSYLLDWVERRLRGTPPPLAELTFPRRPDDRGTAIDPWKADPDLVPAAYRHMVGEDGVRRALRRLAEGTRKDGVPVVFLRYATIARVAFEAGTLLPEHTPDDDFALEAARKLGYHVLDAAPTMYERMRARGWTTLDIVNNVRKDWHPNARGHTLLAGVVLEFLEREGLLPDVRRGAAPRSR